MSFKVLISTMNNAFHKRDLKLNFPYLIVNQLTNDCVPTKNIHTLNVNQLGLSKSRNCALENANAEICLISDDDLTYSPNIKSDILEVFEQYPNVDIITFKVSTPDGGEYKKYSRKPFHHNLRTLMSVSSVEIALRRRVIEEGLRFDEKFGLGSVYPTGEEVIFLTDAYKKGKSILFYPLTIVTHPKESSGSNYKNTNLAKAKGAVFYRIFSWKGYFICLLFALKHYKNTPYSFLEFLKQLLNGAITYSYSNKY